MKVDVAGPCPGYPVSMRAGRSGVKWGAQAKESDNSPCTNIPVTCQACSSFAGQDVWHWKYNMEAHMAAQHHGVQVPDDIKLSERETQRVSSRLFIKC
mmetsp:Transcript_36113/g.90855  ORF Transcript_36113/g.90855 Transcript_36113/m.90855 type:complete len:98 (+) Transcript_36113:349-642(+)